MDVLLKFSRAIDAASRLLGKGLIWIILLATLISTGNAIARKLFHLSSNATLEIQWYLYATVFLLGGGVAFLQNAHVRIDILANRFGYRVRTYIDIAGIILFLLPLCFFMIYFSWPMAYRAFLSNELSSNSGGLLRWPVYALIPAGFAFLGMQSLSELIKRFAFLMGRSGNALLIGSSSEERPGEATCDEAARDEANIADVPPAGASPK